jgi:putative oxidoreductase
MNLLRLSISPLPAPAGWYALPLRLIIGFGFMQHGYAKPKQQPYQLADAQESLTRARAGSISRKHAIGR